MKVTAEELLQKKRLGQRITVLTCYDYPTALWEDQVGVDVIFVGDSVGTNILGYTSERDVTMDDMIHHLRAVERGVSHAYLLVDMPYGSYRTPSEALANAKTMVEFGADGVKFEGADFAVASSLHAAGITVWGHLGLNPQLHEKRGLRAKTAAEALQLIEDSLELQDAGASFLIYEMIPEEVGKIVSERLRIPTIGIGAGRYTDGQVQIIADLLGVNAFEFRHVFKYARFQGTAVDAITRYAEDVRSGDFPRPQNVRHLRKHELLKLEAALEIEAG